MRVPLTIVQARDEVVICVRKLDFPVLEDQEIELLLRKSKRQDVNRNVPDPYETWTPITNYSAGTSIVADPRNGSFFTCAVGGTSGAVQPVWPTVTGVTVTDGAVTWAKGGQALWAPTWNLAYGIAFGWKLKMGKVAGAYDIVAAGQSMKRSQLLQNLKEMWKQWGRRAGCWDQVMLRGSLRDRRMFQNITNANDELFIDGQIQWNAMDTWWATAGYTGLSPGGQWIDDL